MYTTTKTDPNTILATLYTLVIFVTILHFWQRRRFYKIARRFAGPLELPFIGVFHRLAVPRWLLPKLKLVMEIYETQTIFSFFGHQPVLYTTDPLLLEKVFSSSELLNKPNIIYAPLSHLFGDGLFSSKTAKWSQHRKLINPSFRLPVLRTFLPVFNRNCVAFHEKLADLCDKGELNINEILEKLTLTAAIETILGKRMPPGTELDKNIIHHYMSVMHATIVMVLLNVVNLSGLAIHFNFYKSRNAVFKFINKLLDNRLLENKENASKKCKDHIDGLYFNETRLIFIDQIFKNYARQQLTWQDVLDESSSVIFAAFETTASAMYYALVFLAMHPHVQDKLFEEIKSIFPEKHFNVEYEHLQQCVYLEMVINETLRLAPSVPTIARGVVQDFHLTDDLVLPRDLVILINIFQVHRDVNSWGPHANAFNPDNFLPENVASRPACSFVPFSKGLRNCVGNRYAMWAMKIVMLHTLRNFRFSTTFKYDQLEFINLVTLKLQETPLLEVHKRDI